VWRAQTWSTFQEKKMFPRKKNLSKKKKEIEKK
jgi:hypothetical protein